MVLTTDAMMAEVNTTESPPIFLPTSIGELCRKQLEDMNISLPPAEFYCTCFKICDRELSEEEQVQQQAAILEMMAVSHGRMGLDTVIMIVMYVLILACGITGNVMVLITIARFLKQKSVLNIFIASLSCADLLVVMVNIPIKIWQLCIGYWIFGQFACYATYYLLYTTFLCSVITLTAMSIERYLAICHPLKAQYASTPGRAKRVVCTIWVSAAVLGVPTIFVTNFYGNTWVCNMVLTGDFRYRMYAIYLTVVIFFGPTVVMAVAYGKTSLALWRSVKSAEELQIQTNRSHSYDETQGRLRVIRMLLVVWLVFLVCWLPFMVGILLESFEVEVDMRKMSYTTMIQAFTCLAYSNSCVNPFLYAFLSSHFRHGFTNCCLVCCPLKRYRRRVAFANRKSFTFRSSFQRQSVSLLSPWRRGETSSSFVISRSEMTTPADDGVKETSSVRSNCRIPLCDLQTQDRR